MQVSTHLILHLLLPHLYRQHLLKQSVKMLGNISEPHRFIGNMDVLLLLSFREVFPMVVIEAMATGTPIVSIDVGGINEAVIDGESGVLIP
ncbi:glycosyltransferase, partial [Bacillus sp. D-CC]